MKDKTTWEKEDHYRLLELLLNDFKNKKLNYTEFIDRVMAHTDQVLEEERKRLKEELMEALPEAIDECPYRHECYAKSATINQITKAIEETFKE